LTTYFDQLLKLRMNTNKWRWYMDVDAVGISANISAPEFIGPIYTDDTDTDYYFICRIVYTDSVEVSFDVTMLFDGEQIPRVAFKTVSSAPSLDVIFTPQDFTGHYGKLVCHRYTMTINCRQ